MSRTLDIACHDCKKTLWIGQRSGKDARIYKSEEHTDNLSTFLFQHERHRLEFGEDQEIHGYDYEDDIT